MFIINGLRIAFVASNGFKGIVMANGLLSKMKVWMPGMLAIAIGGVSILAWWIDHNALAEAIPGYAGMTFNTALNFVLMGSALLITSRQSSIAGLVTIFGSLVLLQDITGGDFGIDRLFYAYNDYIATTPYPGRMAPTTASCFILSSLALIFINNSNTQKAKIAAQVFGIAVFGYGLSNALLRLIFPETPQAIAHFASMSLFTSIGFIVVSTGIWLTFNRIFLDVPQTPFSPAVFMLGRLKLTHKFILVSFVVAIPVTIGLTFLINDIYDRQEAAEKQSQGLEYINHLKGFFELVPQHRGMSSAYLRGDHTFKEQIHAKRKEIALAIQGIIATGNVARTELQITEKWKNINDQWQSLIDQGFEISARDSWRIHTTIIHETILFMQHVLSVSGLAIESDQGNQHLVKGIFEYLVPAIEMTGQIRGLGAGIAAGKTINDEMRFTLLDRTIKLKEYLNQTHFYLKLAFQENSELESLLESDIEKNIEMASQYVILLEEELLTADSITIDATLFFNQGTDVIDVSMRLFSNAGNFIDDSMINRVDRIAVAEYFMILFAILGLAFFCYIFIAFYLAMLRSIMHLDKIATKLLQGDLNAGIQVDQADELGKAVDAIQRIAAAIAATSLRTKSIVDNATDSLIMTDDKGMIEAFNPASERLFGYCSDEVIGSNFSMLIPDSDQFHLKQLLETDNSHAMTEGIFEESGQRKDGSTFPLEMTINAFTSGGCKRVVFELRDISQRLRSEAVVRQLSQSVNQAGESILITDKDGNIEYTNPAFTKITGYTFDEVEGMNPRLLKSGKQDHAFYKTLWDTISHGEKWQKMIVDKKKDGTLYPALLSISPIYNKPGHITHYVAIQQDMTEYEQLENQFRQAQKMEAIGTLVGGIAHDFNNMLAGMTGNLYLAGKQVKHLPEVQKKLKIVEDLSYQASDMIQQLLTFARKSMVEIKPFGLVTFLKEITKLHSAGIPENILFQKEFYHEELVIKGDATQIQQVVVNLLNNACDAVEDVSEPRIRLKLEKFEADETFLSLYPEVKGHLFAHIMVEDNGHGINKEDQKHIFEPFFSTKEVGKGTGLGLAMAYGAIQSHGGIIDVKSTLGQGTAIHIYLPLKEEVEFIVKQDDIGETAAGGGETILIVDDNADVRVTTREVLESLGYHVLEAADGLKAVNVFTIHQNDISLVLTDQVMPRLSGTETAKRIRTIRPEIKIIFMTGYDKDEVLQIESCSGEHVILSKPCTVQKLSQAIRNQLDS
jgi:PAS domain S-box-containing protein